MADRQPSLVVVGAGLAAAHVVTTVREAGDTRPVALVGDEGERPYERPGLSKGVLQGRKAADSLYVHDMDWYASHQVQTYLDDPASSLDLRAQLVTLASGRQLPFTDLVLATGARPRVLPIEGMGLSGVHTLRKMPDSRALREAFATNPRVVVVGAGWIGLEVAAAAREAGCETTVLEYAAVPLRAALGDELGGYFAELHRRHGVDLRTGVQVTAIEGDGGRVTGVRAAEELFVADLVVVGVGAQPNVELAEQAGLTIDNGIVVDDQLRAREHVYAIGDAANAMNVTIGRSIRVEHWDNAIRQGALVARVLLGEDAHYDWQPYFFTDQYDLGMEYVGLGAPDDDVVIRGSQASGEFIAFWLRHGVLAAAMNVNIWDVNDQLRAAVGRPVDAGRLADPDQPLESVLGSHEASG